MDQTERMTLINTILTKFFKFTKMEKTFILPEGAKIKMVDAENNLVIYEEKEPEFKRGDFLISKNRATSLEGIYNDDMGSEWCSFLIDGMLNLNSCIYKLQARLMTDTEKSNFIKKMNDNGWDWDTEKLEVVPYAWKPKHGKKYYLPSFNVKGNKYIDAIFEENSELHERRFSKGFICKTTEEASELYDAIVEFIKEWRKKK